MHGYLLRCNGACWIKLAIVCQHMLACWHHMHAVGRITCMNKFAHIHVHVIEMFLHARLIKLSCYHVVKLPTHSHFLNCDSLAIKFHCENVYNLTNSWVNLGLIF